MRTIVFELDVSFFLQVRASLGDVLVRAAHVLMVVERNPMERKVVGAVAVERARRLVGRRRRANYVQSDPQREEPLADAYWVLRN